MLNNLQIATLLKIPKIGKKTILKISNSIGSQKIGENDLYEILNPSFINISKQDLINSFEQTQNEFYLLEEKKIEVLGYYDDNYPFLLKEINDFPILLYYKGNIKSMISFPTIAVIGTRNPTKYGYKIGERIGEILAENKITVVSGLALGCDTSAHQGCINKKGKTVAILAHGLHTIYPKSNSSLADEIIENEGCLVSEYAYGIEPQKYYFVERDRLQSGSSYATVVIETDIQGGSMHTVKFTKEQNRYLYCYNHPKERQEKINQGNQLLISRNEALPINTLEDVKGLINFVNLKFNKIEIVKFDDVSIKRDEISSDIIKLSIEELMKRFKIKSLATINKYIKSGKFADWSEKKDPEQLRWNFNKEEKLFYTITRESLFDK